MTSQDQDKRLQSAKEYARSSLRALLKREPDENVVDKVARRAMKAIPTPVTREQLLKEEPDALVA